MTGAGRRRRALAAALLAAAAASGACGDSGSGGAAAAPRPTPDAAAAGDAARLQAVLDRARRAAGTPGAAAALAVNGRVAWSGASGRLGPGRAQRLRRADRFILASVTKLAVAAMVMRLVEAGRLSLDDRLSDFAPGVPNAGRITVRMLLAHRSGLPEYDDPALDAAAEDPRHPWTRDEVIRAIARGRPAFAPGSRFAYTNSNYVLLGRVIERATGGSVEAALQRLVASPLGLRSFSFRERLPGFRLARGSELIDGTLVGTFAGARPPADAIGPVWTDGGIAATAPDLARFAAGVFGGRLLAPASVRAMTAATPGSDGYGLGVAIDGPVVGHDGAYGGFSTYVGYDRETGASVAALANREDDDEPGPAIGAAIWAAVE